MCLPIFTPLEGIVWPNVLQVGERETEEKVGHQNEPSAETFVSKLELISSATRNPFAGGRTYVH